MKRLFIIAVLLLAVSVPCQAREVIIGEYSPECTAVNGDISTKVSSLLGDIRKELSLDQTEDMLVISVRGYADLTGGEVKNEEYAKERAFNVASIITNRFPKAKVNLWNKGADPEVNKRVVIVNYDFIERVVPSVQPASTVNLHSAISTESNEQIGGLQKFVPYFLFVGAGLVMLVFFLKGKKKKDNDIHKDTFEEKKTSKVIEPKKNISTVLENEEDKFVYVGFSLYETRYIFKCLVTETGRYVSLKEAPGKCSDEKLNYTDEKKYLTYVSVSSVKGSLKSSFKQDSGLIELLRQNKRLYVEEKDPEFEIIQAQHQVFKE